MRWTWVFHQTEGAPVTRGLELMSDSPALNRAAREIAFAKARCRYCIEKFGANMWIADDPIKPIVDTDLPIWMREDVEDA
jgi:hypothetical protein